MYNNSINYADEKYLDKVLGQEVVDRLIKDQNWLKKNIFSKLPILSDCPLIWSDIIRKYIETWYTDKKCGDINNIAQIKEKFGHLEIYLNKYDNTDIDERVTQWYKGRCAERTEMIKLMFKKEGIKCQK